MIHQAIYAFSDGPVVVMEDQVDVGSIVAGIAIVSGLYFYLRSEWRKKPLIHMSEDVLDHDAFKEADDDSVKK